MSFVLFEVDVRNTEPICTIHKNGIIYITKKFLTEHNVENKAFMKIFIDQSKKIICIKFLNSAEANTYHPSSQHSGASKKCNISKVFKFMQLNPAHYCGKYTPTRSTFPGTGDVFVIKLQKNSRV